MEADDEDEMTESGEEERDDSEARDEKWGSWGKSTAMVPPKVGRLVSPHMIV